MDNEHESPARSLVEAWKAEDRQWAHEHERERNRIAAVCAGLIVAAVALGLLALWNAGPAKPLPRCPECGQLLPPAEARP